MFRAFVLLLMLPTMLMPPGMCVCRFVPIGKSSAGHFPAHSSRSLLATHDAPASSDCACDSCRLRATLNFPILPGDQPAHSPTGPGPAKHWPGCPAEIGELPLPLPAPTAEALVALDAIADPPSSVVSVASSRVRVAPLAPDFVSPPLFLSHCALQI
jgi:hypothetical protein